MRTRAFFGLALILATAAFGGEAFTANPVERLVPANAVALVQATEVGKLREAFGQSALGEAIQGSQMLSYLRTVAGAAAEFGAVLVSGRPAEELRGCLGQHAALALLDFESVEDLRARVPIVALVEVADAKKLDEVLTGQLRLLSLLRSDLAVTSRQEAGTTVRELALPNGKSIAWCFRDGFLMAGTRGGLASLLGSLAADGPRIGGSAVYQAVRQATASAAGVAAYVDLRALVEKAGVARNQDAMQKLRGVGLATAQAAGLALDFDGRQVRERLYLHTGPQQTGLVRLLTTGEPVSATGAAFVPAGYTAVASLAIKDVGLWDRVRAMLIDIQGDAAGDFVDGVANHLQQRFGIHPKAGVLDTFTDEVFLAADLGKLSSFQGAGRQPRPQELPVLFGARLRDAAKLADTSDRLAANEQLWEQGIERSVAKHGGASIFTFKTPFNVDLRPSYAIADDLFLISLRPEPVAAALDARKAGKTFAAPGAAPAAPAHLLVRVDDAGLLGSLLGCIRGEPPEGAQPLLAEADRLLAGLHGYELALRREPLGVSLTARSDLGTAGTLLAAAVIMDQTHPIVARRVEKDFDQIAAALEAYRAKKGTYPETLNQLLPEFLPSLVNDRFAPARPYGYSRGQAGADGQFPDAWIITCVGPDKQPDIPIEQFDPPVWAERLRSQDPEVVAQLKRVLYRFHPEQYADERKNDDEGDLCRMGGKGLAGPPAPAPKPKATGGAEKPQGL